MKELIEEAKQLVLDLLPSEDFGENEKAERLWEILEILETEAIERG